LQLRPVINIIPSSSPDWKKSPEKLGMTVWRETIRAGFRHSVYRLDRPTL
jgi:hypothetical protein